MEDLDLVRRLRQLRRTVHMLATEVRNDHLDLELLARIDLELEQGIGTEPRCTGLRALVDALRESTLTPRPELMRDTVRACEKLKDGIEGVVSRIA